MNQEENQLCEACGVTAEMGYIISEGDEVAEVTIFADSKEDYLTEFNRYLSLAQQVNERVMHDMSDSDDFTLASRVYKFKFECSAEKLIFELKSRSLN